MSAAQKPLHTPGIGLDLVDLDRFAESWSRSESGFRRRVFTDKEQAECDGRTDSLPHYAARFAAKEAAMKALGTGWSHGVGFTDFEILSDGKSAPRVCIYGEAAERLKQSGVRGLEVSLTHTPSTAGAVVMLVR